MITFFLAKFFLLIKIVGLLFFMWSINMQSKSISMMININFIKLINNSWRKFKRNECLIMFVNRIKICPDLLKLQLWFFGLRQCLFLKLLRQWTLKMGRFMSTINHSHLIFIWYTNSRLRLGFLYEMKIGCSCFI
jgi:hypothetical protein